MRVWAASRAATRGKRKSNLQDCCRCQCVRCAQAAQDTLGESGCRVLHSALQAFVDETCSIAGATAYKLIQQTGYKDLYEVQCSRTNISSRWGANHSGVQPAAVPSSRCHAHAMAARGWH